MRLLNAWGWGLLAWICLRAAAGVIPYPLDVPGWTDGIWWVMGIGAAVGAVCDVMVFVIELFEGETR